jgi:hypothetical protein
LRTRGFPWTTLYEEDVTESESDLAEMTAVGSTLKFVVGFTLAASILRSILKIAHVGHRKTFDRFYTAILDGAAHKSTDYARVRKEFLETPIFYSRPSSSHSHAKSASIRTTADRFSKAVAAAAGYQPYCFQMSSRDQSEFQRGERTYYWAKDTSTRPQADDLKSTDLVTMVDVDYYVDMPNHLVDNDQPHILFTTIPDVAAKSTDEYGYFFNANSELVMSVRGGGSFVHPLWNYCSDWFTVSRLWSLHPKTVVYHTAVRRISDDKACVLLVPSRVYHGIFAVAIALIGRSLQRLTTYVGGGFSKVRYRGDNGLTVSVARVGEETSATIPVDKYNALKATKRIAPKTIISNYSVKSVVGKVDGFDTDRAAILTDYLNNASDCQVDDLYSMPQPEMVAFSFVTPEPEDKPIMEAFCDPLVPPAFVPMNNKATADRSIDGRVRVPQETARKLLADTKMTPKKQSMAVFFVEHLIPEAGCCVPLSHEEVCERQQKASQKLDMQKAGLMDSLKSIVTTFVKKEAYGKPTDPRNITTFPPDVKARYAAIIYPLMDVVKKHRFYAFSKSPKWVAQRVAEIATKCKDRLNCPDLHRMDGHVEKFARLIERMTLLRAYDPAFHEEVIRAHEEAFGNTGITAEGTRYDQGFSRGSGSMETSLFNTIVNLFIIFYAFVLEGCTPEQAWEKLNELVLAGGDDSVVGQIAPAHLIVAAQHVGFIMVVDTFIRGQSGVNFLAREYGPDVWNGDPNSMCQIRRQTEKLHLTVSVPLSPAQKMYEKAVSFSLTDSATPVLGTWCAAVKRVCRGFATTGTLTRFGDDWEESEQYPNEYADWMLERVEDQLKLVDWHSLELYLEAAETIEELLHIPPFYEQGREYTFEDWDPEPGLLVKRTVEVLTPSRKVDTRAQLREAMKELPQAVDPTPTADKPAGSKKKRAKAAAETDGPATTTSGSGGTVPEGTA